ncbi:MAG TPA: dihydrolipoamide acetyltransferase family protein [Steroidobacteraceae bacterium]|nr:dihydrolipoamide acetyltransferase family protein [Steroidobacteraceae bacterium]
MTRYVFKMPDLGEGTVQAEVVAWHVKVGDDVREDQVMAEVMTDKAAVEVPSPVSGRVVSIAGQPGDTIRVGAELIVFETESSEDLSVPAPLPAHAGEGGGSASSPASAGEGGGEGPKSSAPSPAAVAAPSPAAVAAPSPDLRSASPTEAGEVSGGRVKASPATRRKAREAGIDLRLVHGSGTGGRITPKDFEAALNGGATPAAQAGNGKTQGSLLQARTGVTEVKVIGVRRLIAQRMTDAARTIPHFSYVEEVDVTELESLRQHLNSKQPKGTPSLTYLPFLAAAIVRVLEEFPQCNAHYDAERGVLLRHHPVHLGVATQTPDGLKVPVVRHAEARTLWALSDEIRRVSEAARAGKATREELTGSTITVTSLGKMGGIVSTPIINAPEMGIIGVNKAIDRPVVLDGAVAIRRIMNLSSSWDHRFVDGYDAAAMILALKDLLEHPATIFIPG